MKVTCFAPLFHAEKGDFIRSLHAGMCRLMHPTKAVLSKKIFLSLDKKNIKTKYFALESPNFWFLYTYRKNDEHHGKWKSISRFTNHVIFFPNVPIDPEYISLKVLGGSRICNQDMKTFTQSISKFKWTRCHYLHKFELCDQHQDCSAKT